MKDRIWKYQLQIIDMQTILVPPDFEILSVGNQNGNLCLWLLVDSKAPADEVLHIEIIGTGNHIYDDMGVERKFIGTVIARPFVWHVFERK